MLTKKQIQARIQGGLVMEEAENSARRNATKDLLSPSVMLAVGALKKAGLAHAGWWRNNFGNESGLEYRISMSSIIPGTDVEIRIHKGVCDGSVHVEVKRETSSRKFERSFFLGRPNRSEAEQKQEVEDFQLFVTLMVTDHFPDSKYSAIVFDARGNRRV